MPPRCCFVSCAAAAAFFLTGCSIITPAPLWELAKATGAAASAAIPYGSSKATNTVYHFHAPLKELCIEFNQDANVPDLVPALQLELKKHQIESRLYESTFLTDQCNVWLKYTAYVAWDIPPLAKTYRPYLHTASLTLQSTTGLILSSSEYELGPNFELGKWASTQNKLAPVVTALLTGFQN
jgi:hypothetical protein